jgi:transposase
LTVQLSDKAAFLDFTVEVVRRLQGQQGFAVQPGRWVVERTFAWLLHWRRLVRDYEERIDVSQNMIYLAMGSMLLHRIFFR